MTAGFRERVSSGVSPGLQQGFSVADICIFLCFEGNMFSGEEGMQEIVNKLLTIWISALFFQLYADFIILPQVAAKSEKHGTVCAAAVRRPGERERRQEPYFSLVRGAGRLRCGCSSPGAGITISPNLYLLNAIARILILFAVYQICQFLHFALQQGLVR